MGQIVSGEPSQLHDQSGVMHTLLNVKLCQDVPHLAHFVVTVTLKVKVS